MSRGISMIVLILIPVGLLIILTLVGLLLGRRARVRSVQTPSCGRCFYPVRGLSTFSCPECGSDLREVGILTPAMRRPLGPWLAILFWSLALPIPAMVISGLLSSVIIPERHVYEDKWTLTPTAAVGIDHLSLRVSAESLTWPLSRKQGAASPPWNDPPDEIEFSLFRTSNATGAPSDQLIVDFSSRRWHTARDQINRPLEKLDAAAVAAWLGADAGENAEALAQPIVDLVQSVPDNALGRQGVSAAIAAASTAGVMASQQNGGFSMSGPSAGGAAALVAFWIAAWLAGCVYFYRRQSSPR